MFLRVCPVLKLFVHPSTTLSARYGLGLKIASKSCATQLLNSLEPEERVNLLSAFKDFEPPSKKRLEPLDAAQKRLLLLHSSLPFACFGMLDNFLLVMSGQSIDKTAGVIFGMSTLAAAALGNIVSNICGLGASVYIVTSVGIKAPEMSHEQIKSKQVHRWRNFGRVSGMAVGCVIGMTPLLFYDETQTIARKQESHEEMMRKRDFLVLMHSED